MLAQRTLIALLFIAMLSACSSAPTSGNQASEQPTAAPALASTLAPIPTAEPTTEPTATPEPKDPLTLSFQSSKPEYASGDQIQFTAVYTNNTAESIKVTHTLLGGGLIMIGSGGAIAPGESASPALQDTFARSAGSFPVVFTVSTLNYTPPFTATATITVTVK